MEIVTSADGTRIAFERSGDGPPLVVVGGSLNDRRSAASLSARLVERFTVVRYDRRGRGDSGNTLPYHPDREVEDLAAVIGELGEVPSVYGHSSGGALAIRAAGAGVPVRRLAVYETPYAPGADPVQHAAARERAARIKAVLSEGRRTDAVIAFLVVIGVPPEVAEAMRRLPRFADLEAMADTLAYEFEVLGNEVTGGAVPAGLCASIKVPVLIGYGGGSPEDFKAVACEIASAFPDGRLVELPAQTHDVSPDVIAPLLTDFFAA